uniref:CHCH domain-containing protein n=1 Tax=Arion vulgaris TaxID=1028688 RepID=A0A0B7BTU5_9EUPU
MSYCKKEGKDEVIFATREDLDVPSTAIINFVEDEADQQPGLILPNGNINWECPCLGGMASGPCGVEFRNAFTCFHHSKADPKGSDCFEAFLCMQDCMGNYPELYPAPKVSMSDELSQMSAGQEGMNLEEVAGDEEKTMPDLFKTEGKS